jgi:hypothetical protein
LLHAGQTPKSIKVRFCGFPLRISAKIPGFLISINRIGEHGRDIWKEVEEIALILVTGASKELGIGDKDDDIII